MRGSGAVTLRKWRHLKRLPAAIMAGDLFARHERRGRV
jgi:hypothetical protein